MRLQWVLCLAVVCTAWVLYRHARERSESFVVRFVGDAGSVGGGRGGLGGGGRGSLDAGDGDLLSRLFGSRARVGRGSRRRRRGRRARGRKKRGTTGTRTGGGGGLGGTGGAFAGLGGLIALGLGGGGGGGGGRRRLQQQAPAGDVGGGAGESGGDGGGGESGGGGGGRRRLQQQAPAGDVGGGAGESGGGGSGNGGQKCTVTFYTAEEGGPLAHNGKRLSEGDVAVRDEVYGKYAGRSVVLNGRTYQVVDSCAGGACKDFDVFVNGSRAEAAQRGIQTWDCSWKP